jgi:hypothetical protein
VCRHGTEHAASSKRPTDWQRERSIADIEDHEIGPIPPPIAPARRACAPRAAARHAAA